MSQHYTQPQSNTTQPESEFTQPQSNTTQPEFNTTQPESNKTFKPVVAWIGGGIFVALFIFAFWSLQ